MSNSRRIFIKQMSLATAGAALLPYVGCAATQQTKKFGIQLYSLRDELPKGVENVISQIAKAGYSFVEGFGYSKKDGYFGLTVDKFKSILDQYNLYMPSAHFDFIEWEKLQDDSIIKSHINVSKAMKQDYIIVPYMTPEIFKSVELTKNFAKKINRAGEIIKDAGLKLAYHNHNIEFVDLNGITAYDVLLEETNPEFVNFQMDLYWVVRANKDPLTYFKQHPGRFPLWHVKDMRKSDHALNTEIGNGELKFKPIFEKAAEAGLILPIVEQENYEINPFTSLKRNASIMKKISI